MVLTGFARAVRVHVIIATPAQEFLAVLIDDFVERLTTYHPRRVHAVGAHHAQHGVVVLVDFGLQVLRGIVSVVVAVEISHIGLIHHDHAQHRSVNCD